MRDAAPSVRARLGVIVKDLPAYAWALARGGRAYLAIRNRAERLEAAPDGSGFRCDWLWTSDLHAAKVFPTLGRLLMRRALADHPVLLHDPPPAGSDAPRITFLIGHRGLERLPHLLATLRSIGAQQGAAIECIVVEQDAEPRLAAHVPAWVRLLHAPPPKPAMPYCRSWAFNFGARYARSDVLVLHDGDMLVPGDYARWILERVRRGYEVVNPKRFVFYLGRGQTMDAFGRSGFLPNALPEAVVQNCEGGGSVAITRSGYAGIGGMDESFVGWGGEDNEFWERARTLRVWPWGGLPVVHLWHPPQAGKQDVGRITTQRHAELACIEPERRIERLHGIPRGQETGPSGWEGTR